MTGNDAAVEAGSPEDAGDAREGGLLARMACGDDSALDELVRTHQGRVTALACRLLGWSDEADDVVQDVFLAALRNVGRFQGRSSLSTWLTAITVNECRRRQRAWRAATAALTRWVLRPRPTPPGAHDELCDDERFERVRRAVTALRRPLREVIVLRYFQEMPVEEMAAVLGASVAAVHVRLTRARGELRHVLGDLIENES